MEFFFFLFLLFIAFRVATGFAKEAKTKLEQASREAAWMVDAQGRLRPVEEGPAALPAPRAAPVPDPWWEVDADAEEERAEEVEPPSRPLEVTVFREAPLELDVAPRPLPSAAVALDVEVDREAEHARLHDRIDRPRRGERPDERPASAIHDLHDRAVLRRAILASEVLGPPRALRELD